MTKEQKLPPGACTCPACSPDLWAAGIKGSKTPGECNEGLDQSRGCTSNAGLGSSPTTPPSSKQSCEVLYEVVGINPEQARQVAELLAGGGVLWRLGHAWISERCVVRPRGCKCRHCSPAETPHATSNERASAEITQRTEVERLRAELLKYRKIAAHVPAREWIKAKESAGYATHVFTLDTTPDETTADDESFLWIVLDNHGQPMHVTVHKQMGHDHINECISQHIDAGLWRVVKAQIVDECSAEEPTAQPGKFGRSFNDYSLEKRVEQKLKENASLPAGFVTVTQCARCGAQDRPGARHFSECPAYPGELVRPNGNDLRPCPRCEALIPMHDPQNQHACLPEKASAPPELCHHDDSSWCDETCRQKAEEFKRWHAGARSENGT